MVEEKNMFLFTVVCRKSRKDTGPFVKQGITWRIKLQPLPHPSPVPRDYAKPSLIGVKSHLKGRVTPL